MKKLFFPVIIMTGIFTTGQIQGGFKASDSSQIATSQKQAIPKLIASQQLEEDFIKKRNSLHDASMFKVFDADTLTGDRLTSMKFLYAYMPLPDVAAYPPEFFLKNVDVSLKAKVEMPWGDSVPQREFLHFVLPLRVNNEPLDSSRWVFYEELKDRVSGLTMKEAILETNHWCHEKVSYRPSDGRTSSPLSAVSQAIGRCGEESTFTVAALRSIGIPARQVYTPRWAHTDDNHAWVEAYADGKWWFLGACEPEPVLNLGWFNEPASRGILMNTNVIGVYEGEEEKLSSDNILTTINVTPNYTATDTLNARVTDVAGNPLEDIPVSFCVYNYAEFYPVVTKKTDEKGDASLIAGNGDMLVWATDGENFGFNKGNSKNDTIVNVVIDKPGNYEGLFELLMTPSPSRANIPVVSEKQRRLNNLRFAKEDSIRFAYIETFVTEESAKSLANELGLNPQKLSKILTESRGNHKNITDYLFSLPMEKRAVATDILLAITEKDRRDIPIHVLEDNVINAFYGERVDGSIVYPDSAVMNDYILNPRIEREPLVDYKGFFKDKFSIDTINLFRNSPEKLRDWVVENISVETTWNPQGLKMDPVSVWKQRSATAPSRNIFFVALARSMGIPAQVDPVTLSTRFMNRDGNWQDIVWDTNVEDNKTTGKLVIDYTPRGRITDPLYYTQFSLSKFENGVPVQLEYDDEDRVSVINAKDKDLEAGKYILTSGQRMADGSVLTRSEVFDILPGTVKHVSLILPQDSTKLQVIGSLDAENMYYDLALNQEKSLLSTTGRGYYVLSLLKANHEPSKHVLNDMILAAEALGKRPEKIMLIFPSEEDADSFDFNEFSGLPSNVVFGVDKSGNIENELKESLGIENNSYPFVVVADTFNRVVYFTSGYTIASGERLLDTLDKLSR